MPARSVASSIAPAMALVLSALAFETGAFAGPEKPVAATDDRAEAAVARLQKLIDAKENVRARAEAIALTLSSLNLTDEQVAEAHRIILVADGRLQKLHPVKVSLEEARVALESGDLAKARRHAEAARGAMGAQETDKAAADRLLASVAERAGELAPMTDSAIAQISADLEAGRYASAKAGLESVTRSAVALDAEQQSLVQEMRSRIVKAETERGAPFVTGDAALGLLQPDVIRRRTEEPQQPENNQPENQPEQPEAQPETQPEAQPEQPEQPAGPPDLIDVAMRAQALGLLAEADRAFDESRYPEAQSRYRELAADPYISYLTDEQRALVRDRLQELAVRLDQPVDETLEETIVDIQLIRSRTQAEFDNYVNLAEEALRTGDIAEARSNQAAARLVINGRRQYYNEQQLAQFDAQLDELRTRIERREEEMLRAERQAQQRSLEERAREAEQRQARERQRQINEFIDRARAYQSEQRYVEALQTVEQLLFLDPTNPSGLLLREVYADIIVFQRYNQIQRAKSRGYAELALDNQQASIPDADIVNFPPDWRAISIRRGQPDAFQDTPVNRQVYNDLGNQTIATVNLRDNTLEDVITYVETLTRHNIDADWNELADVGIQPETTVSLTLRNVSVDTLLDRVMNKVSPDDLSRAAWEVRDGIITVSSDQAIRRNTHLHIYDVRDLLLDVPDYDQVPEIDLQQAIQQAQQGGGGGGGQSPFEDDDDDDAERRTLEERTQDVVDIITNNVDFEGWIENGGETGQIQDYNGNLIITNTVANHQQISGLLQKLRQVRAMQINVETRFLLVNQDFFEQVGFDLDVYFNADNNQVVAAQGIAGQSQASSFFGPGGQLLPGGTFQPPPADNNQSNTTGDQFTEGAVPIFAAHPRGFSPIAAPQNSLGIVSALLPDSGIAGAIVGGAPALGVAGQFLDDVQVDFLVQATQADRRSVQLTAPRLTFTNGQVANIYVVTQSSYVADLEPVVGDSAAGFDPTIGVVAEGVTMLVEGVISADRRYVTMNVDVGVSRIDGFDQSAVTIIAGGQLVNSAAAQSFIQQPTVTITRVRTTVTVPDQGTVLLGGQRLVTEFEVESGVPVLSKIPILNRFFSNRAESKEEQTLLILIKPTVLIQNELEEMNSPGLSDIIGAGIQ